MMQVSEVFSLPYTYFCCMAIRIRPGKNPLSVCARITGTKIVGSLGQGVDPKLVSELRAQELRITAPEQFPSILEQITKPVDIIASCSSVMLEGRVFRGDEYYRTILGNCITEHFGDYNYS